MNFIMFLRLVGRNFWLMFMCGVTAASLVFYLTQNEKKEYQTKTVLNTGLVSGYNIESNSSTRIDYAFIANEIENILSAIKSRQTHEELAAHLLAYALLQRSVADSVLTEASFLKLKKEIPPSVWTALVDEYSFDNTLTNIKSWRDRNDDNIVEALLEESHPFFGVETLQSNIATKREGTTDMIQMSFTSTDPALCRYTLIRLTEIAVSKHRAIKEGQTSNVLSYFEQATSESVRELKEREDGLLQFMVNNKIINYYEQTRFIAGKKEDLDELYFSERMKLAAADSARSNLEWQLSKRINLPQLNEEIVKQRHNLANISGRIAQFEIGLLDTINNNYSTPIIGVRDVRQDIKFKLAKASDQKSLKDLQQKSDQLKTNMRRAADATFTIMRTPDGIEIRNMLNSWLNKWIEVEEVSARLNVFTQRKQEFDETYARFAPWGSRIKRIEREISVSERSYLENLHSLNVARMHRYNTLMSTNLRVVDPPQYPDKAKASKRIMSVIIAFLAAFIIVLVTALAFELLDGSLKDPDNAKKLIGLELFTAFPKLPRNWLTHHKYDYVMLLDRSVEQLLQHIKIDLRQFTRTYVARVGIMSTLDGDGKSFIAAQMIAKLRVNGNRVLYLRPQPHKPQSPDIYEHEDNRFYAVDHTLFDKEDEADLLTDENVAWHHYNYIVTVMPPLMAGHYPAKMLNQMDISILVARANRTWMPADRRAVQIAAKMTKNPCRLVLNATRVDLLESSLGELPRRRSFLRRIIKKIAKRNWSRNNIT